MKLWELFNKKYVGRKVEWVDTYGEKHKGRVSTNTYDSVCVFEDDEIGAMRLSQHDMQIVDFEIVPKYLSFTELQNESLYGVSLKFVYNEIVIVGIFTTIIEQLNSALASDELINALLKGKWYILSE